MAILEKHRSYGQLLIDFANANTSDEAGLSFLKNIKEVFNEKDKDTLVNYPRIDEFGDDVDGFPTLKQFYADFQSYHWLNDKQRSFIKQILEKVSAHVCYCEEHPKGKLFPKIERVLQFDIRHSPIGPPLARISGRADFIPVPFEEILQDCAHCELTETEANAVLNILNSYYEFIAPEHQHIDMIRKELKHIFNAIIDQKFDDFSLSIFYRYNLIYNEKKLSQSYLDPSDDGRLSVTLDPAFDINFFMHRADYTPAYCLQEYYDEPVSYCLIEFFRDAENREYLKVCNLCGNFYIASKLNEKQKYCPQCSRKSKMTPEERRIYMKEKYRPAAKKRKEVHKRNEEIGRLMSRGFSEKKAREFVLKDE